MICNKCGKTIVDDAVFCSYCGAKQELSCEECGTKLPLDARFCHRCGAPTEKQIKNGLDWEALTEEAAKAFDKKVETKEEDREWNKLKLNEDPFKDFQFETALREKTIDYSKWEDDDVNREELRETARRRDAAEWEEFAEEQKKSEAESERVCTGIFAVEEEEIPDVPTKEKVEKKEFVVQEYGSRIKRWNRTLEVQTRFDDEYAEDTDPMHFLFPLNTFYRGKLYKNENKVPELDRISAYALAENGIYFAEPVTKKIKFWNAETGEMTVIGTDMKDVLFMDYDGGFVTVETFERLSQTAWSEHRDECGYMFEAWYDIYDIHTKKHTFLAVK